MEDWISTLSISALREANIIGRNQVMADERYKILIMADMQAMHHPHFLRHWHSTVQGDRAGYG